MIKISFDSKYAARPVPNTVGAVGEFQINILPKITQYYEASKVNTENAHSKKQMHLDDNFNL